MGFLQHIVGVFEMIQELQGLVNLSEATCLMHLLMGWVCSFGQVDSKFNQKLFVKAVIIF